MKTKKKGMTLLFKSFLSSLGVVAYVSVLVSLMNYAGTFSKVMPEFLGPIAMLLLFVLSATVVGALVLGKPILMYVDGKKPDAIKLFCCNIAWLLFFIILVFIEIALVNM